MSNDFDKIKVVVNELEPISHRDIRPVVEKLKEYDFKIGLDMAFTFHIQRKSRRTRIPNYWCNDYFNSTSILIRLPSNIIEYQPFVEWQDYLNFCKRKEIEYKTQEFIDGFWDTFTLKYQTFNILRMSLPDYSKVTEKISPID